MEGKGSKCNLAGKPDLLADGPFCVYKYAGITIDIRDEWGKNAFPLFFENSISRRAGESAARTAGGGQSQCCSGM